MSFKSPNKLDADEVTYISELGWLATLAVSIASLAFFAA